MESESRVEGSGGHVIVCLVEPGFYRIVDEAVEADAAGECVCV